MKVRSRKNRRQRRGFTLMEVLVVMAILVVLASTVTFAYLNVMKGAESDQAYTQVNLLKQACDKYKLDNNNFPNQLQDLITPPQGANARKWRGPYLDTSEVPLDPWNQEYIYQVDRQNNRVVIVSYGPDLTENTIDDIRSDQK